VGVDQDGGANARREEEYLQVSRGALAKRRVKTELRPLVYLAAAHALAWRLFALGDRRRNSLSFIERQANHCIARLCRKNS